MTEDSTNQTPSPEIGPKTADSGIGDNQPKILVELSPAELSFLCDISSDEFWRMSAVKALLSNWENITDPEEREKRRLKYEMVVARQQLETKLRNRILKNAVDQGFGDL